MGFWGFGDVQAPVAPVHGVTQPSRMLISQNGTADSSSDSDNEPPASQESNLSIHTGVMKRPRAGRPSREARMVTYQEQMDRGINPKNPPSEKELEAWAYFQEHHKWPLPSARKVSKKELPMDATTAILAQIDQTDAQTAMQVTKAHTKRQQQQLRVSMGPSIPLNSRSFPPPAPLKPRDVKEESLASDRILANSTGLFDLSPTSEQQQLSQAQPSSTLESNPAVNLPPKQNQLERRRLHQLTRRRGLAERKALEKLSDDAAMEDSATLNTAAAAVTNSTQGVGDTVMSVHDVREILCDVDDVTVNSTPSQSISASAIDPTPDDSMSFDTGATSTDDFEASHRETNQNEPPICAAFVEFYAGLHDEKDSLETSVYESPLPPYALVSEIDDPNTQQASGIFAALQQSTTDPSNPTTHAIQLICGNEFRQLNSNRQMQIPMTGDEYLIPTDSDGTCFLCAAVVYLREEFHVTHRARSDVIALQRILLDYVDEHKVFFDSEGFELRNSASLRAPGQHLDHVHLVAFSCLTGQASVVYTSTPAGIVPLYEILTDPNGFALSREHPFRVHHNNGNDHGGH